MVLITFCWVSVLWSSTHCRWLDHLWVWERSPCFSKHGVPHQLPTWPRQPWIIELHVELSQRNFHWWGRGQRQKQILVNAQLRFPKVWISVAGGDKDQEGKVSLDTVPGLSSYKMPYRQTIACSLKKVLEIQSILPVWEQRVPPNPKLPLECVESDFSFF